MYYLTNITYNIHYLYYIPYLYQHPTSILPYINTNSIHNNVIYTKYTMYLDKVSILNYTIHLFLGSKINSFFLLYTHKMLVFLVFLVGLTAACRKLKYSVGRIVGRNTRGEQK